MVVKLNGVRSFKRCVSFCTAQSYDLTALASSFKRKKYQVHLWRDVLHIEDTQNNSELFFFNHGCFVSWGSSRREELKWINYLSPYAKDPLQTIEIDYFCYQLGEFTSIDSHERFKLDMITLDSNNLQIKLAISYALVQSIKLEAFEEAIQAAVQKNSSLPEEIANRGAISLSRRSIFKRMGEIFIARSLINLNSEYLDTPEFFWRNPNFETYYILTKKFLDIPSRVMALNQKLDVLQELLDILNSQVQHRHSSLLETIIILLILIEIVISLIQSHVLLSIY
jgi:uncharacterized Rmd1/YagE family protein